MTIKIIVADDHEVVRQGIAALLANSDIEIVAEAKTGTEAVALTDHHKPDVVVLDVRMPDGDGLNSLGRIKLNHPAMPVVMLSAYDNPTYRARAVALGANGYLLKTAGAKLLMDSIRTAATGENFWTRDELRRITGALATPRLVADVDVALTKREGDVLTHLTEGLTNKEIATELHISYETVKEHVQHILGKIGVSDRTQAAVWAVRNNVVANLENGNQ